MEIKYTKTHSWLLNDNDHHHDKNEHSQPDNGVIQGDTPVTVGGDDNNKPKPLAGSHLFGKYLISDGDQQIKQIQKILDEKKSKFTIIHDPNKRLTRAVTIKSDENSFKPRSSSANLGVFDLNGKTLTS